MKHTLSSIAAVRVLSLFALGVFAAESVHIMMRGPRQSTKTVSCPDGSCKVDGVSPGQWTVTLVDDNGKPLASGSYKLTFTWTATAPRDAASGMATGKMASSSSSSTGTLGGTTGTATLTSPRDAATGQASGKRQHKPITIVKEWGASSPQLRVASPTGTDCDDVDSWSVSINFTKIEMK